jgi:DNA-binding XRE family transcriptional regulator
MSGIKVANRQGVSKQIGDRLKQLRESLNHNRNQMADRLGITVSSYSRYEGGYDAAGSQYLNNSGTPPGFTTHPPLNKTTTARDAAS